MLDAQEEYRVEQYHGHAPVYGLMLNADNTSRSRTSTDGLIIRLSAHARWCYTVMKSFGPEFKASRRKVADRMGLDDVDTVSKLQIELEEFGLLRSEESAPGMPRKWTILEPEGRKVPKNRPTGFTGGSTKTPPVSTPLPTGSIGTETVKKSGIQVPININKKRDKYELRLLQSKYYEVFDPRHPAWSERRDNKTLQLEWEALNGTKWLPKQEFNEADL